MRIALWSDRWATGEGAGGYTVALARGLRARGHVVDPVEGDVRIAIARRVGADIYRASGGVHEVAMRSCGRRATRRAIRTDWLASRARICVANSRMVADQLVTELGVRPGRIEVVRTGVDLDRFRVQPRPDGPRRVLFAAHGWHRKGFRCAVAAFRRVAGPGDTLWVAGRDGARTRRLAWARWMVGDALVDVGPAADLAAVLPTVQAVLHPTRYDAASNLVLESMACGVPIVTSWMDGSAEIVEPGWVVSDPTDDRAVAGCLRRALDATDRMAIRDRVRPWPESRNHEAIEALASRCVNG